jgi:hypothetical protein
MKQLLLAAAATILLGVPSAMAADLPSWKEGATKKSIVDFVQAVTKKDGPDYVKPEDRIAVFDNDGTLWCEKPMYPQMIFAADRAPLAVKEHPELKEKPPFPAVLSGGPENATGLGARGALEFIIATHSGMDTEQFKADVLKWTAQAKHPRFKHLYTECVYQPMLELLDYLRKNEFRTWMVSGGGTAFMQPWTERIYGIPPEQVVGTQDKLVFQMKDGKPRIEHTPEVEFVDDGPGKPVGIEHHIGRRPIAAFGNSDGDVPMLEWTSAAGGKHLGLLVHHTDADREYAYDKESKVGHLEKGLEEARVQGWTVVDMKNDWSKVFPFEK